MGYLNLELYTESDLRNAYVEIELASQGDSDNSDLLEQMKEIDDLLASRWAMRMRAHRSCIVGNIVYLATEDGFTVTVKPLVNDYIATMTWNNVTFNYTGFDLTDKMAEAYSRMLKYRKKQEEIRAKAIIDAFDPGI
jgi:hypothetical protein